MDRRSRKGKDTRMEGDSRSEEVEVWLGALDDLELPDDGLFSAAELARADALATPLLRHRFLARRWMVRELLRDASRGEPGAGSERLWWSTSNSGGLAAVAVAGNRVGIDIERSDRGRRRWQGIARRFYTEAEHQVVAESPARFLELWTMKEAYLKALGVGLAGGLRSLDCARLSVPNSDGWRTSPEHPGWRFAQLRPESGCVGAIAIEGEPGTLAVRRWIPETADKRR